MKKLISILGVIILLAPAIIANGNVNHKNSLPAKTHHNWYHLEVKRFISPYLPNLYQDDFYAVSGEINATGTDCTFYFYYDGASAVAPVTVTINATVDGTHNFSGTIHKLADHGDVTLSPAATDPETLVLNSTTPTSYEGIPIALQE